MPSKTSTQATIMIIGAGVIGLAVAAQLAGNGRDVYVVEKNESFGRETSSRNSETIHAGIYYPAGSLKATTCVEGNALLYELCERHDIGHRKTGKLILAAKDEETGELASLLEQGKANGVKGLRMLSRREVRQLEPNVEAVAAVFSPSSGTIDSQGLMRFFARSALDKGAHIAYRSEVRGVERLSDGYQVTVTNGERRVPVRTEALINCAGLNSDSVARLAGIDIDKAGYRLHYCKGEYFSVGNNKNGFLKRLIYPVPEAGSGGTGIHATLDMGGRLRLGPNARYVREVDYRVDESQKRVFFDAVRPFLPFIEYGDLEPEMAGIRPKLQEQGGEFRDFVIRHESDRGLPGFINLVGIESPGLTAAPAIGRCVARMVNAML